MRLPDPSVAPPTRSAVVAAPVRGATDNGPAFDDVLQAAAEPKDRRPTARRAIAPVDEGRDSSGVPAKVQGVEAGAADAARSVDIEADDREDETPDASVDPRNVTGGTGQAGTVQASDAPASPAFGMAASVRAADAEIPAADTAAHSPGATVQPSAAPVSEGGGLARASSTAVDVPVVLATARAATSGSGSGRRESAASGATADVGTSTGAMPLASPPWAAAPEVSMGRIGAGATPVGAGASTAFTSPAAALGEGVRAMGELTVRVTDAAPPAAPGAPSADPGAALASAASPSGATPGALATAAPIQPLGDTPPAPQTTAAASAPAGRPAHTGHPPLSAQVGTELLSLRRAADGDHIVTIAVRPDNLGPVTISAVVGRDGMSVELFSPSAEGRDALKQMLPDLRRDLTSTGGSGSSLDLGSRDAPQERPRPREFSGGGHVAEPLFRATLPAVQHPSSARLDVLV